ncbi:phospholipid phosphatase 1-like isoform X2 [Babylonia areolata]|uniref:phospholipid phosphatase 1-like isoform X2 n=1 Tax=Babylonia areolata TaxID=304850 RepID=UPI003FD132C8
MLRNMRQDTNWRCRGAYVVEGLVILFWMGATVAINVLGKPSHQGFSCDDTSIRHPYKSSTVPNAFIITYVLAAPILMMLIMELGSCLQSMVRNEQHVTLQRRGACIGRVVCCRVGAAYAVYFFGYLVVTVFVTVIKLSTGELRPHFLAVCKPDVDLATCNGTQYIVDYKCTNTEQEKMVLDSRQSFPSGHAAYGIFTAVFMILYTEWRMTGRQLLLLKLSFYAVLTLFGLWVAATRVIDNMHHMRDVVAGGVLGLVVGLGIFFGAASRYCFNRWCCGPDSSAAERGCSDSDNSANVNNNRSDEDDDMENGNLDNLEAEAPTTPTPLLNNGVLMSSNTGLRIGPLRLEGDKHKFPRRATLQ